MGTSHILEDHQVRQTSFQEIPFYRQIEKRSQKLHNVSRVERHPGNRPSVRTEVSSVVRTQTRDVKIRRGHSFLCKYEKKNIPIKKRFSYIVGLTRNQVKIKTSYSCPLIEFQCQSKHWFLSWRAECSSTISFLFC